MRPSGMLAGLYPIEPLRHFDLILCDACGEQEDADESRAIGNSITVCRYCASAVTRCRGCNLTFNRIDLNASKLCGECAP